jgi:hypothetical protein
MTTSTRFLARLAVLASAGLAGACGGGGGGTFTCDPAATPTGCSGDYQCEAVDGADGGTPGRCFPPAYLEVTVVDPTQDNRAVSGARVVAIDADTYAAAAPAAVTGSNGVARIPVVWPRSSPDTTPSHMFALRVSAAGYYDYPGTLRTAIPVSVQRDPLQVLPAAETEVHLLPMANAPKGAITGNVLQSDGKTPARGVLVVAETNTEPLVGYSAVSDAKGDFAIYNVESRAYVVSGLFAGMSFPQSSVSVSGATVQAKLVADATPQLASVTGQVSIVAAAGITATTVVLRVRSTHDVPPGLRVATGGSFVIDGVPTGTYEAVAGWGIDGLVLDPDPNIAGTQVQEISVVGQDPPATFPLDGSFKVTDAVQILGPGVSVSAEPISGDPIFRWKKYPQADFYRLSLWDGMGTTPIWTFDAPATGAQSETVTYPGDPQLVDGQIYQWWVEAMSSTPTERPLSHGEDQLGVFEYVAP